MASLKPMGLFPAYYLLQLISISIWQSYMVISSSTVIYVYTTVEKMWSVFWVGLGNFVFVCLVFLVKILQIKKKIFATALDVVNHFRC